SLTPSQARPAEPHATNAPLATPGGSRVLAYDKLANGPWEAAVNLPLPTTTTKELLKEAEAHLISVDPGLKKVIEKFPCRIFSPEGLAEAVEPWKNLASMIMAQQVSGAAAKSIKNKFISLFPSPDSSNESYFPHPSAVAAANVEYLRTAGLSGRKAEYIQGVAERFASGELSARMLVHATDEEVMKTLVAIRGLGKWSVEMFECFTLKRMDVFSTGDLGVQRGMAVWQGKDVNKLKGKSGKWKYMSEEDMLEHSAKFAPYRSLFMWYMWKMEDVNIDAIAT
ncbi:DNA glycosylase, partial [Patellaria atrata CBS 101060]